MKMKKLVAATMAAALVACSSVPAFAAELNEGHTSDTVKVYTTTEGQEGYGKYTVTIPAEVKVDWKGTTKEFDVTINSKLSPKQYVKVAITGEKQMKQAGTDVAIDYTLSAEEVSAKGPVVNNETTKLNVNVDAGQWDKELPAGEYASTLTFTSSVETQA